MKSYEGRISVIVPAFNEGDHIYKSLQEIISVLDRIASDHEIIVVDDGSTDNTHAEADRASAHLGHVKCVRHEPNFGKGEALKYGYGFCSGDPVAFLDADLDLSPDQLATLFKYMRDEDADVVIGSKRHPLSKLDYPPARKIYSMVYFWIVRILFGLPVHDTQTGLKMFKNEVLKKVFPRILVKRYAFDLEVLVNAHRLGYKIVEAPVSIEFQRSMGRIRYRDIVDIFLDTLAIFYRARLLHYYDRKEKD